jgi:enoyl-CoA hydratase
MKNISLEIRDRIAVVTLQKAPANVFDQYYYTEIKIFMEALNKREDYHVVILRSGCKHFSGGGDLDEINEVLINGGEKAVNVSTCCANAMAAVIGCKKPVIAAVHGNAVGAGTAIAASCDIILAEETSRFSVPEITVGFVGASEFMQQLMPKRLARYYVLTGKPVTAVELKALGGILDTAKDRQELMDKAFKVAGEIVDKAPMAVTLFKTAMNDNDNARLREKYLHEMNLAVEHFYSSKDAREIAAAYQEKRPPIFSGE